MRHMVVIVPELTGYAGIRSVFVSVALVPQLLDGKKYMVAGAMKPPDDTPNAAARGHRGRRACAAWSGGRRNVTAPNSSVSDCKAATTASASAPDWHGLTAAASKVRSPRNSTGCSRKTDWRSTVSTVCQKATAPVARLRP